MNETQRLVEALSNENLSEALRDDAAMDLGDKDDDLAELTLLKYARSSEISSTIASSCGTSLAEIWLRKRTPLDPNLLANMRIEAVAEIKAHFALYE